MSSLKSYYRKPKAFIPIPTQGKLYELKEDKSIMDEIGVMPMTMMNHLTANNPESLINGNVVEELIKDCTSITSISPRKLYKCDVDAILMGIRMVSVDDTMDVTVTCPECKKENEYGINLKGMLGEMTFHDELPYKLQIDDLVLNIVPTTLESSVNTEQSFFQDAKSIDQIRNLMDTIGKNVNDDGEIDEGVSDKVMGYVNEIYSIQRNMTETTIRLYADSIQSVSTPDGDVYDRDEIFDFVKNLSDNDHKQLKNKVKEISAIGIPKSQMFTCVQCKHEFSHRVEMNPTDFFGNGSQ